MESSRVVDEEIVSLLNAPLPPSSHDIESAAQHTVKKISIFSVGRRPRSKERVISGETDFAALADFMLWVWSDSKYSGIACVILSSFAYGIMGVLANWFSVTTIPAFETIFIRSMVVLIAIIIWIKKSRQPLFGLPHVRHLLLARAVAGFLSLLGFFYSIKVLPFHVAVVINFTTPMMAAIIAVFLLQETVARTVIGGMICSFIGVFIIYQPISFPQEMYNVNGVPSTIHSLQGAHPRNAVFVSLLSAVIGGANYCFIRAAAKASEQPLTTVFSFSVFACPAALVCMIYFQQFEVPGIFPFVGTTLIGLLAFIAEVLLARALQLEKVSKVTTVLFLEALVSSVFGVLFLGETMSASGVFGAIIIAASTTAVMFYGFESSEQ